jgi:hypothetical protein
MSRIAPRQVGIFEAAYLCFCLLFRPKRFEELNALELARINQGEIDREPSGDIVRTAFFVSLVLVVLFGVVGYVCGVGLMRWYGSPSASLNAWLQIVGAGLLLWGTLFVRGWEIATFSDVTLPERVNRWLYRAIYCFGTGVLICSMSWSGAV